MDQILVFMGCGAGRRPAPNLACTITTILLLLQPVSSARASIFNVTTSSDTIAVDGLISLREALTAASTNAPAGDAGPGSPGLDWVRFAGDHTVAVQSPLPQISDELLLSGPTGAYATVDGTMTTRPFSIAPSTSVTMERILVTKGRTTDAGDGGAIENLGQLTLESCLFTYCISADRGGAVYSGNGSRIWIRSCYFGSCVADSGGAILANRSLEVLMQDSLFLLNGAVNEGGAVRLRNVSSATVARCLFDSNVTLGDGGAFHDDSTLTMTQCSFIGNLSAHHGGGLFKAGLDRMEIFNTTFSSNETTYSGGGIFAAAGQSVLNHVTVADNLARGAIPEGGDGGGIHTSGTAELTVANCLIAKNRHLPLGDKPDISGVIQSGGHNLIGNIGQQVFSFNTVGDIYGDPFSITPPNLGAERFFGPVNPGIAGADNNAGLANSYTHALLSGSPALDAADPASTAAIDQRGYPRPRGAGYDIGAFESMVYFQHDCDNYSAGGLEPPGGLTGWSSLGFNTLGFAWPDYSLAEGAFRGHVAADPTHFRVSGIISNFEEWLPYTAIGPQHVARAKYYVYAGGQSDPGNGNLIPNLRLRLSNRFAVNSMLEVFHHNPADPGNAALAAELRPSVLPTSPSLYRVDYDPVDVPYLQDNAATEGVARAFETYAIFPAENGYLALAESCIGVYPVTLIHPRSQVLRSYETLPGSAGDFEVSNEAEVSLTKLIPQPGEGAFALLDPSPPLPTHTTSTAGVTLDTSAIPQDRVGIASRDLNPDRTPNDYAGRVRVQEGKQYVIRWALSSNQDVNKQAQIRLRVRSIKFAWSQKLEIGGAWGTDAAKLYPLNANNSIAQQSLPGWGGANPEDYDLFGSSGWYTMLIHTPMSRDIRPEFPPETPLHTRMPNISVQPNPGVDAPSRRDLLLGVDLIDSISGGLGAPLEQGRFTVHKAEIREFQMVPD